MNFVFMMIRRIDSGEHRTSAQKRADFQWLDGFVLPLLSSLALQPTASPQQ
jgi:hypothetical protein